MNITKIENDKKINDIFLLAIDFFNKNKKINNINNEILLDIYGLYKIATKQEYKILPIYCIDIIKISKNKAHKKYLNLSDNEAKLKYIDLYKQFNNNLNK
jgi:acyl-CoA-binding protein